MANKPTKKYEDIPDAVLDFAYGLDGMDQMEKLESKYDLGSEASSTFYGILDHILKSDLVLGDLLSRLKKEFDVEEDTAKNIRIDFAGRVLLPITVVFDGLEDKIKGWGGDLKEFEDVEKVKLPQKTAEEYLDEVLEERDLKTGIDRLDSRLMAVLKPYVTNARSRDQAIETLQKSIKTGGLDLSKDRSEQLVDEVGEELSFVEIVQDSTIIKAADTSEETPDESIEQPEEVPAKNTFSQEENAKDEESAFSQGPGAQATVREPDTEAGHMKGSQTSAGDDASKSTEDEEDYVDLFADETKASSDDVASQDASEENEKEVSASKQDASRKDEYVDLFANDEASEGEQEEATEADSDSRTKDEEDDSTQGDQENSGASKRIAPPPIVSKVSTEITEADGEGEGEDGEGNDEADTDERSGAGENNRSMKSVLREEAEKHGEDTSVDADAQQKSDGEEREEEKEKAYEKRASIKDEVEKEAENLQPKGERENQEKETEQQNEEKDRNSAETGSTQRQDDPEKQEDASVGQALEEKAEELQKTNKDVLDHGQPVDVFDDEDAQEIKQSKERTEKITNKVEPAVDLDSAVENVVQRDGVEFEGEEMKKRFRNIVETRMRDIRDAYETRSRLEATPENGGVGLSGGDVADVMQVIEDVFVEYHESLEEKAKEQAKAATKKRSKQEKEKEDKEKQALEKRKEARYKKIANQVENKRKTEDSASDDTQEDEDLVDLEHIKEAAKNEAENGEKKERPKMQDVRFEQKLSGPVEQLKRMRLVDFRRLSSDPQKAIDKIEDDIDLLESDGYEKRVAGIEAWRKSPVNQEYAELSRRSLNEGKRLEAVVKQQPEEEKTLNWKEVQAIMELNDRLRF